MVKCMCGQDIADEDSGKWKLYTPCSVYHLCRKCSILHDDIQDIIHAEKVSELRTQIKKLMEDV